jgi:hypothetical protein
MFRSAILSSSIGAAPLAMLPAELRRVDVVIAEPRRDINDASLKENSDTLNMRNIKTAMAIKTYTKRGM